MDTIKPHLEYRSKQTRTQVSTADIWHTTFMGHVAVQAWQDFMLWEEFLNETEGVNTLLELGTFEGGFSLYLMAQCLGRGINFLTADWQKFADFDGPVMKRMKLESLFLHTDIFAQPMIENIVKDPKYHPMILFCDNGKKSAEMQTFVPMLKPGDYMAVHDWNTEVNPHDVDGLSVEMMLSGECEELNSLTRFFRVI